MSSEQKAIRIKGLFNNNGLNRISLYLLGSSTLQSAYDVKMSYFNDDSFYVVDEKKNFIGLISNNGTLRKHLNVTLPFYFEILTNGYIYVTTRNDSNVMYKIDQDLTTVSAVLHDSSFVQNQYGLRYSTHTGYLYGCDTKTGYINAYNLNLNRITANSFYFGVFSNPMVMQTYMSSTDGLLFYVSAINKILYILKSDWTLHYQINVQTSNGYELQFLSDIMLITLHSEKKIKLFASNGTHHLDTGKILTFDKYPLGFAIDSCGKLVVAHGDRIDII